MRGRPTGGGQNIQDTGKTPESLRGGSRLPVPIWATPSAPCRGSLGLGFSHLPENGRGLRRASLWLLAKPGPGDREEVSLGQWEGGSDSCLPPRLMTPQSLGITPKQPPGPGREDTAPPHPGHSYLRPPAVTHREGQTMPGTVDTLGETHTLSHKQTHTDKHPRAKPKPKPPHPEINTRPPPAATPRARAQPTSTTHSQAQPPERLKTSSQTQPGRGSGSLTRWP